MTFAALSDKRWTLFLKLILVGLAQSICFVGLVYWAKEFVESNHYTLSMNQGLIVATVISILAFGRFYERYVAEQFAQNYVKKLREKIYHFSLRLPPSDRDLLNKGSTLLRLTNDMSAIRTWVVQGLAPLTVLSVWFLFAVTGLFQIHWLLGAALAPCLLVIALGNYLIGGYLYESSKKARKTRGKLIRSTTEKLQQFYLIKSFNQQGKERRQFNRRSARLLKHQLTKAKIQALLRGFNEAALLGTIFILFISAIHLQSQNLISIQSIAVLLTAALYLLSQMRRLSRLYEFWTLQKVALDKLNLFFSRPTAPESGRLNLPTRPLNIKLRKLRLKNRFIPITQSLDESSRVALVGNQGLSKSTLLMALAGLVKFDSGTLVFNGRDSSKFHPALWSKTVTLISHNLPLLRGSVRSNIFYGARHEDNEYTNQVLELVQINEFDLDRICIAETGRELSDCEIFRIKLARALLRRPKLLLIDDDTALKDESVINILQSLFRIFDGAIIIAVDIPGLSEDFTNRWDIHSEHLITASPLSPTPSNIIEFDPTIAREKC